MRHDDEFGSTSAADLRSPARRAAAASLARERLGLARLSSNHIPTPTPSHPPTQTHRQDDLARRCALPQPSARPRAGELLLDRRRPQQPRRWLAQRRRWRELAASSSPGPHHRRRRRPPPARARSGDDDPAPVEGPPEALSAGRQAVRVFWAAAREGTRAGEGADGWNELVAPQVVGRPLEAGPVQRRGCQAGRGCERGQGASSACSCSSSLELSARLLADPPVAEFAIRPPSLCLSLSRPPCGRPEQNLPKERWHRALHASTQLQNGKAFSSSGRQGSGDDADGESPLQESRKTAALSKTLEEQHWVRSARRVALSKLGR